MKYTLKTLPIDNGSGHWKSTLCHIFCDEVEIGSYLYRYYNSAEKIFQPFNINGKDYAIISTDYTTVSFITLPDCTPVVLTDESKENLSDHCPVECWIPRYKEIRTEYEAEMILGHPSGVKDFYVYFDDSEIREPKDPESFELPIHYHDFGFVAGCVWGDDSGNWKVNFLDLSGIEKGEVFYTSEGKREWTYKQLPSNLTMKQAIKIDRWSADERYRIEWAVPEYYDLENGKLEKLKL